MLQFEDDADGLLAELSATAIDADGFLWVGSDEYTSLERLSPQGPGRFGEHRVFPLADFVGLPEQDQEVDIEGLAYDDGYLWVCGSHSAKRKKPKEAVDMAKDLKQRIAKVKRERNRYLLARLPVQGGGAHRDAGAGRRPVRGAFPIRDPLYLERFLADLRRAGLPKYPGCPDS